MYMYRRAWYFLALDLMFKVMSALRINQILHQNGSQLSVTCGSDTREYHHFVVHGHAAWPDVDKCDRLWQVKLNDTVSLYASSEPWGSGYHGTSASNLFSILMENGFDLCRSGDVPAVVCLAPKFDGTG